MSVLERLLSSLDTTTVIVFLLIFLLGYHWLGTTKNLPPGPRGLPVVNIYSVSRCLSVCLCFCLSLSLCICLCRSLSVCLPASVPVWQTAIMRHVFNFRTFIGRSQVTSRQWKVDNNNCYNYSAIPDKYNNRQVRYHHRLFFSFFFFSSHTINCCFCPSCEPVWPIGKALGW